ncbi:MAG: TonB-dependent receptor, partial [Acidobacteria bacterium]|nr:TonB-dependent receptor [Acidobacteriota bacterium]
MKHFSTSRRVLATVALLASAALSPSAHAQVLYGSVVGTLEDPSGAAIPSVNLVLTNTATGKIYEDKTDGTGRYAIGNVIPGTYDFKASAPGFKTQTRTGLTVTANTVSRVDLMMQVGALTEEVTVSADATQLQTDKSDSHTELNAKQIANIPLPGYRNYQSLINLVPGATPAAFQNSATDSPGRSLATNINGTNKNNNTTRIDGAASVNLWLPHHAGYVMPAEMVDVVNVTTTAADAEQGMSGGAAVTVLTKSGTNEFRGSAFWYHDNQHLKARNYFQPVGVQQPLSIYNNYGGTIGGPIVKNKLFFFYSFDGTKQRSGATATYSVPTADIRTGNFSAYSQPIYDPATGDPVTGLGRTQFAGNIIPTSRITPQGAKLLSYFPQPNLTGAVSNFFAGATPKFDRDYNDVKINYNRTTNHSIYFRWGRMGALVGGVGAFGDAIGGAPGSDPGLGDTKVKNMSVGHTWTISPNLILDGVIGYQRQDQVVRGTDFGKDFRSVLGIPGIGGDDPRQQGFPNVSFNGYTGFGVPGWMPLERIEQNYTMSHNLSVIKGSHEMRFGFDGTNYRMNHWQPELGAGPRGSINFTGGTTSIGSFNQYNSIASTLLGLPYQYQKSIQYILMTPREFQFGIYARDRWQVNKKLTVNLGLRWEYYPLMTRAGGKGIERLDAETNQVFMGGRGNVPVSNGMTTSKRLFAPRVGIAYRLNDKTVLRTGYGISYDPLPFSRPLRGFYPLTVNF